MHPYPHHYDVEAQAMATGNVEVSSDGLPSLQCAPPEQFGGPGDLWSPETLLVGAVANCFILSFRGIARAAHLEWSHLECRVDGVLDRIEGVTRFASMALKVQLKIPAGMSSDKAEKLLTKAKKSCLISNSLNCESNLDAKVLIE